MYFFGMFTVRAQRSEENHVLPSARKTVGAKSSEKGMLVVCVCVCVCSKNCADHGKAGTIQIQKYHSMGYSLPHPSHIPSGDSQESRGRKMRFSARSRRLCRRVRLSPDMVARGASSRLTAQIILPPCSCPYSTKRPGRPPRSGAGIRQ